MDIVKHLAEPERLTVSFRASVNFLSLCGPVAVGRKFPQSKNNPIGKKDRKGIK